ncbi:hypothetical protein RCL1_002258 [Eukaryota sp. TZLM3-RCL]
MDSTLANLRTSTARFFSSIREGKLSAELVRKKGVFLLNKWQNLYNESLKDNDLNQPFDFRLRQRIVSAAKHAMHDLSKFLAVPCPSPLHKSYHPSSSMRSLESQLLQAKEDVITVLSAYHTSSPSGSSLPILIKAEHILCDVIAAFRYMIGVTPMSPMSPGTTKVVRTDFLEDLLLLLRFTREKINFLNILENDEISKCTNRSVNFSNSNSNILDSDIGLSRGINSVSDSNSFQNIGSNFSNLSSLQDNFSFNRSNDTQISISVPVNTHDDDVYMPTSADVSLSPPIPASQDLPLFPSALDSADSLKIDVNYDSDLLRIEELLSAKRTIPEENSLNFSIFEEVPDEPITVNQELETDLITTQSVDIQANVYAGIDASSQTSIAFTTMNEGNDGETGKENEEKQCNRSLIFEREMSGGLLSGLVSSPLGKSSIKSSTCRRRSPGIIPDRIFISGERHRRRMERILKSSQLKK